MNTILVLGSEMDGDQLVNEDVRYGFPTRWTLHKDAEIGDRILFYITAPVSAIVAAGTVSETPEYQGNPNREWYKHWLGEVSELKLTKQTPMRDLRSLFPEWRQLFYLRCNAKVPTEIVEPLLELLEIGE